MSYIVDDTRTIRIEIKEAPPAPAVGVAEASIVKVSAPSEASVNSTVTVTVTVRNVGGRYDVIWVGLYDLNIKDWLTGTVEHMLKPNESKDYTLSFKMPNRDMLIEVRAGHIE